MEHGRGKHLTWLHLYTNYTITDKSIKDMTPLQYQTIVTVTSLINKFKTKHKPMVVI